MKKFSDYPPLENQIDIEEALKEKQNENIDTKTAASSRVLPTLISRI
jgi:hypothetical protein